MNAVTTSGSLASLVRRGPVNKPLRGLIYGVEGVGKTQFGAEAPNPIFLGTEDGLGRLEVARFPEPKTWADVLSHVRMLSREKHEFKTLVIDTLDHLEPLVFKHVCTVAKVESIDHVGGGYGKGFTAALDQWRILIAELEKLRDSGVMVLLLAHAAIKNFENPEGPNYNHYTPAINDKAGGLFKQWCDFVFFARFETFVTEEKGKRSKAYGGTTRVIRAQKHPAYDAKNRLGLPASFELSYEEFERLAFGEAYREERKAQLANDIRAALAELNDEELNKITLPWLEKKSDDATAMAVALNRLQTRLSLTKKENGQ